MAGLTPAGALVAAWVCTSLSVIILLARLASDYVRKELGCATSYLAALSIFIDIGRAVSNIYILRWNTISDTLDKTGSLPSGDTLQHSQLASKLSLVARLLITSFYWLQCSTLLLTYRRLLNHVPWVRSTIWFCWVLIGTTYVAVLLTTFLECQPLSLNWQPTHPPNSCVYAYAQLLVQCLSNIAIDLVLLVISTPVWRHSAVASRGKKIRLGLLFTLGIFCIVVTIVRCWQTFDTGSSQIIRSLWASLQGTVAAAVANAAALYGAVRIVRRNRSQPYPEQTLRSDPRTHSSYSLVDSVRFSQGHNGNPSLAKCNNTAGSQFEATHVEEVESQAFP